MALRMEFDEVISQGNNISARSQDVVDLQTWMNNVVNDQLPSIWQGSGYQGYAERVAGLTPSFEAMRQLIEDIGTGVVQNANEYRDFDNAAASRNRG